MFIMLFNPRALNTVVSAAKHIKDPAILDALSKYIKINKEDKKEYTIMNTDAELVHFTIEKYDYKAAGLNGNYDEFYEYKMAKDDTSYIVSTNEDKLRLFCGYINRLTNW